MSQVLLRNPSYSDQEEAENNIIKSADKIIRGSPSEHQQITGECRPKTQFQGRDVQTGK